MSLQLAVFELDHRQFGVPLDRVERVIRAVELTPLPRAPALVVGAIDHHGTVVPVFGVRALVGAAPRAMGLDDQFLLVRASRRVVALLVDAVVDIIACPAEAVVAAEEILPGWKEVRGVVPLEGGLILIQDLDRFLSLQEEELLEEALREQSPHGS